MNRIFADHVAGVAFSLTLSRNQLAVLMSIADQDFHRAGLNRFVPGAWGLKKRGLVEHNPAWQPGVELGGEGDTSWCWRLTRAGELTMDLLREAGLAPAQPQRETAT